MFSSLPLGIYVALFYSVSSGRYLTVSACVSWILGLNATWGFLTMLRQDEIWKKRMSSSRHGRFVVFGLCAVAAFCVALVGGKGKSFLFVFFALLAYEISLWKLVLGALEEDEGVGMSASFMQLRLVAEAFLFGFASVAYLTPVFPIAPPVPEVLFVLFVFL
jgi:hypothetical protein